MRLEFASGALRLARGQTLRLTDTAGGTICAREGTVWIAICGPTCQTLQLTLDSGRDGVRQGAISSALGTFARILS